MLHPRDIYELATAMEVRKWDLVISLCENAAQRVSQERYSVKLLQIFCYFLGIVLANLLTIDYIAQ